MFISIVCFVVKRENIEIVMYIETTSAEVSVYYELKQVLVAILYSEGSALSMYTRTLGLQGH